MSQTMESPSPAPSVAKPPFVIRTFGWQDLPPEFIELRRRTFVDEKQFLNDQHLISENDRKGCHIGVYDADGVNLLGATHVMFAEESDFSRLTGVPVGQLRHAVHSSRTSVDSGARYQSLFSLLFYAAMRWARVNGRTHYVGYIEDGMPPFRKMVDCEMFEKLPKRRVEVSADHVYWVVPAGGEVEYAMHRTYATLSKSLKEFVRTQLMPTELETILNGVINDFYKNPWFEAVWDETLTKNQYVKALSNLHQYVRWTTRLLATIAGNTADDDLRNHFLDHLNGEVDHEQMLERDLAHLGVDVDFVKNQMSPQPDILSFMAIQNSLASFERDPVVFLAVPIVAEGLSANLTGDFIKMLERRLLAWGVAKPKSAISFLASHIHTDGGERGHWLASVRALASRLTDEAMQQRVLAVVHAIIGSMNRAYASYMHAPDIGAYMPKDQDLRGFQIARESSVPMGDALPQ